MQEIHCIEMLEIKSRHLTGGGPMRHGWIFNMLCTIHFTYVQGKMDSLFTIYLWVPFMS